jgi:hypothetical protein
VQDGRVTVKQALGIHEKTERMERDTLAKREKVLGLDYPDMLTSMSNLALVPRICFTGVAVVTCDKWYCTNILAVTLLSARIFLPASSSALLTL